MRISSRLSLVIAICLLSGVGFQVTVSWHRWAERKAQLGDLAVHQAELLAGDVDSIAEGARILLGAAAESNQVRAQGENCGNRSAELRRHSVLLVDDDPIVRDVLATQLADEGYEVAEAGDDTEALDLLDRGSPTDMLVSDLAMPGMDGVALVREAQRRRPGLPATLLTGYAGDAARLAVGEAVGGAFTPLRKPVAGAQLADQVAVLLDTPQDASVEAA